MPIPITFRAPFYCEQFYHLVFKSVGDVLLFRDHENRPFFLNRFINYFKPVLTCWAYCLLDNHAHFVVRIKNTALLQASVIEIPDKERTVSMKNFLSNPSNEFLTGPLIEKQVNRFMVSYTHSYNKYYKRSGGLFQSPFRRSLIPEEQHLFNTVLYIHSNAKKHGLITDYRDYLYSSYNQILTGNCSIIDVPAVLDFFGGIKYFIQQHTYHMIKEYEQFWSGDSINQHFSIR